MGARLRADRRPRGQRPAFLVHPTGTGTAAALSEDADRSLEGVIGPTRHALLAGLDVPRTTTELAALHHLSPPTVSYHLSLLHRAGLLTRTRARHRVYYQRTRPRAPLGTTGRPTPSWASSGHRHQATP
ncbi:ArsR/SmtB family transcription factor [Streptomyces albus subsp. chlorinus]|uniref:helix-turn-helix domain-containing protein n=1 Tax=Streptomyces albus TaxID=1888 RepID=UPI00191D571C